MELEAKFVKLVEKREDFLTGDLGKKEPEENF